MAKNDDTAYDKLVPKDDDDMPLGLAMSMIMHEDARRAYENMSEAEKKQVEARARQMDTKGEMAGLVEDIADGELS